MDMIIVFFRDILSGTTYTITTVISSILICACLGSIIDKKQKQKAYADKYTSVDNTPNIQNTTPLVNNNVNIEQKQEVETLNTNKPIVKEEIQKPIVNEQPKIEIPKQEEKIELPKQEEKIEQPIKDNKPIEQTPTNEQGLAEIVEENNFEKPKLDDITVKAETIQEPIIKEEEPKEIKSPVPLQQEVENKQELSSPIGPAKEANNEQLGSPIPIIK